MHFKALSLFLAAAVIAGPVVATPAPTASARIYRVSLRIFNHGRLIGAPSLTTYAEEAATFLSRDKAQMIEVIAFPKRDGSVHVNASLSRWTPKGLTGSDQAALMTADGKPTLITLDDFEATGRASQNFQVEVTVRPAG